MNLKELSKYRSQLMGVAMLMVVFHHLPLEINNGIYHYFKQNAGFGVDIFLLLSGIGLYFSISKENISLGDYYKHRAIRIFPIYALIILLKFPTLLFPYDMTSASLITVRKQRYLTFT